MRFWRDDSLGDGRAPLLDRRGDASTSGVGISHRTGQITHHIAPDIDAERDLVMADLAAARQLEERYQVTGIGPTLDGRNGGGDRYYTDGELDVGVLLEGSQRRLKPPAVLPNPEAIQLKSWLWKKAEPLLRN